MIEEVTEHIREEGCHCLACVDLYKDMPVWCSKCLIPWPCEYIEEKNA